MNADEKQLKSHRSMPTPEVRLQLQHLLTPILPGEQPHKGFRRILKPFLDVFLTD